MWTDFLRFCNVQGGKGGGGAWSHVSESWVGISNSIITLPRLKGQIKRGWELIKGATLSPMTYTEVVSPLILVRAKQAKQL
jgi:hypothetical protein